MTMAPFVLFVATWLQ